MSQSSSERNIFTFQTALPCKESLLFVKDKTHGPPSIHDNDASDLNTEEATIRMLSNLRSTEIKRKEDKLFFLA